MYRGMYRKLQGKMPYSEGGPSNGWISKRLIDIGLKRSGSILIRVPSCVVRRSDHMRVSLSNMYFPNELSELSSP